MSKELTLPGKFGQLSLYLAEQYRLRYAPETTQYPPLFVMGPPRSGTTLLYQLLVHRFRLAYFSNASVVYGRAPLTLTARALKAGSSYKSDFSSKYGMADGIMAPHEAGPVWNFFFPNEETEGFNYTPKGWLDRLKQKKLRKIVAGMENLYGAPFVNKNVKHCVRIQALDELYPGCLFIQVKRDPAEVALSILKMRKKRTNDISKWYAVRPKEYEKLKDLPYLEQIISQIFYLERDVKEDLDTIDKSRHILVDYAKLCSDTQAELERIQKWIELHTGKLKVINKMPGPFSKKMLNSNELSKDEKKIIEMTNEYFERKVY